MGLFSTWSVLAIAAITAILPMTTSAAVLPRDGPSGFYLSIQTYSTTPASLQGYNGAAIQAVNGKFWVGGPYHSTALMSCAQPGGSNTTCALNAQAGPQQMYISPDSSLSFTAPNTPVPSGLLAGGASFEYFPGSGIAYTIPRAGTTSIWLSDFVLCKAPANDGSQQIFTLHHFQGFPGGASSGLVALQGSAGTTTGYGASPAYST